LQSDRCNAEPNRPTSLRAFFYLQKNMDTRNFTGVFIPAHIWLHKDLIPAEKMLLGEIASLQMRTGWCTAGRKHFADWLGIELVTVSYYTKKLEKMGFLEVSREGYGTNKMRVNPERFLQEAPSTPMTTPVSGVDYPPSVGLTTPVSGTDPKYNNKYNNKEGGEIEKKSAPATENQHSALDASFPYLSCLR